VSRFRRTVVIAAAVAVVAGVAAAGFALTRDSGPSDDELIQTLLSSPDQAERRDAAAALAAKVDPDVSRKAVAAADGQEEEAGLGLLVHQYVGVWVKARDDADKRASAVRALAPIDRGEAAVAVARALIADRDAAVLEAAVESLGEMRRSGAVATGRLVAGRRGPSAAYVDRGLVAIGPAALPALLPRVAEDEWVLPVIGRMGPDAVPALRARLRGRVRTAVAAAHGLLAVRREHPAAVRTALPAIVTTMVRRLGPSPPDAFFTLEQALAADVLVQVGLPAVPALVRLAGRKFEAREPVPGADNAEAILVSMAAHDRKQLRPLVDALRRKDYAMIKRVHPVFINIGIGEAQLIEALNSHRANPSDPSAFFPTTHLLNSYLSSGNARLVSAARAWGSRNGLTITVSGAPRGRSWAISGIILRTYCEQEKRRLITCRRS
jgi:hypothetical protein